MIEQEYNIVNSSRVVYVIRVVKISIIYLNLAPFVQGIWDCIEYNCLFSFFKNSKILTTMEKIVIIVWNIWTQKSGCVLGISNPTMLS